MKKKAAKKKAAPGRKAVKKKAAKKKNPKFSPTQKTPEQEAASETSDASGQALGQADAEHPQPSGENQDQGTLYHDDPNYLEDSQHDDPYHPDYEHEDHDP